MKSEDKIKQIKEYYDTPMLSRFINYINGERILGCNSGEYEYHTSEDHLERFYLCGVIYRNCPFSMVWLGKYYQYTTKNYDLMKKCYKMRLRHEYMDIYEGEYTKKSAKHNLLIYYITIEIDLHIAQKLCGTNVNSMIALADYYLKNKQNDLAKEYYNKAVDGGSIKAIRKLCEYYTTVEPDDILFRQCLSKEMLILESKMRRRIEEVRYHGGGYSSS